MKTCKFFMLLLLTAGIANAQSSNSTSVTALPDTFQNVLSLGKMSFTTPKNAISIPVVKNKQMHYEYAITFKDQPFEVRYSVAPTGYSVAEAYTGGKGITPHKSPMPDDESGAKLISTIVAMNVGGGRPNPNIGSRPFPPEAVKREFNADWGSTTLIPISDNSFGTEYKFCLMITLYKKDVANAYVFYLGNDRESVSRLMNEFIVNSGSFYALKFK